MRNFPRVIRKYSLLAKRSFLIIFIFFCVLSVCIIINPRLIIDIFPQNCCNKFELKDNFSCGEESIFLDEKEYKSSSFQESDRKKAFDSFKNYKFQNAVKFFEKYRKNKKNDPETLIYLNNAKLMQDKKKKSYTIAVFVPTGDKDVNGIAEDLLRGAAQVQADFNSFNKNLGLKIIIASDKNDIQGVNKLAGNLLSKEDIVAVIGHYASEVTAKTLPVYQEQKIVLISTSAATRKAVLGNNKPKQNFLFRVTTDVKYQMQSLIDALGISQLTDREKVAVFHNPNSTFSKSALEELISQLGANKIIAQDKDISSDAFNSRNTLNQVKQQGAKVLILLPDGKVSANGFKNAQALIKENKNELKVGGQSVLAESQTLRKYKYAKNLWLILTWHRDSSPNKNVLPRAKELWGTDHINLRTAWYYDATLVLTKALTKALKENPSFMTDSLQNQRLAIQKQLKLDSFQVTEGASGTISFDQNGDRKEDTSRIFKIEPDPNAEDEAKFVCVDCDPKKLNSSSNN
jgi:branched-chain amino acid transport system substrate-binding protein